MRINDKRNADLFAIHFSVLLFGVGGIFGKLIDLHPIIIVLGRVVFAFLFLGIYLLFSNISIKLHRKSDYFSFFILGCLLAFHWFTFFKSIQISTVAIGLITYSTFPVFTVILEPIFFKEKFKKKNILLSIFTFVGIFLIFPEFNLQNNTTIAAIWGIFSGLSFSVLSILNRKFVQNYSGIVIAFYQDFSAMAVLIPMMFFIPTSNFKINDLYLLVLLGTIFTAIAHTLFINGLRSIKAYAAGVIACLEPVYGIIMAIFIVNEIPSLQTILGGLIIFTTAILASNNN